MCAPPVIPSEGLLQAGRTLLDKAVIERGDGLVAELTGRQAVQVEAVEALADLAVFPHQAEQFAHAFEIAAVILLTPA